MKKIIYHGFLWLAIILIGTGTYFSLRKSKPENYQDLVRAIVPVDVSTPNSGAGDPLRTAFVKINASFVTVLDSLLTKYTKTQTNTLLALKANLANPNFTVAARLASDSLMKRTRVIQITHDTARALIDSAKVGTDYFIGKGDSILGEHGNWVTQDQFASFEGSGGGLGMYELRGIIGTTTGIPTNGDSLIINTGFISHPHVLVYRDGVLQWFNSGLTNNTGTREDAYVFNQTTGTIIVRPVFITGEVITVHAFDPIVWNSLSPEGGGGGGGGGGLSPLRDSIISVWEFNETSGNYFSDVVNDYNGTGYSTTPNQAGKLGVAVKTNYKGAVVVPYNAGLALTGDRLSISVWFKLDTLPSVTGTSESLVTFWDNTYHITHRVYVFTDNKLWGMTTNTTETEYFVASAATVSTGTWYLGVFVVEGTGRTLKIYLNNVVTAGNAFSGSLHAIDGNVTIGNQQNGYTQNVRGVIDQVGYWYQRLSIADVVLLYYAGSGRAYPFN